MSIVSFLVLVLLAAGLSLQAGDVVTVRPREIDDVLNNFGMGFTTFQRFNGDRLNPSLNWTEGFPIDNQPCTGDVTNHDYPQTTIAYFRIYSVAPCYRGFALALRLKNGPRAEVLHTGADITTWLPGDNLFDGAVTLPTKLPAGGYDLAIALLDPRSNQPNVQLAIEGRGQDGWYAPGKITVATLGKQ